MSNATCISASYRAVALKSDGTIFDWHGAYPDDEKGVAATKRLHISENRVYVGTAILSNVISIAAGRDFCLALKDDRTVVTWGANFVPEGLPNIKAIGCVWGESWVLCDDGTVLGWQSQASEPAKTSLRTVPGLSNVVTFAAGSGGYGTRGVAVKRDGTVSTWGRRTTDEAFTDPPIGLTNVIAVAASGSHSLALKTDETVVGWGWNKVGEATGTPTTNSPDGLNFISSGPVRINGQQLSNVRSIAAGQGYSMALRKDGTVVAWGRMVNDLFPVTVPEGLSNVVAIAAGENFCLAITTNAAIAARFRH